MFLWIKGYKPLCELLKILLTLWKYSSISRTPVFVTQLLLYSIALNVQKDGSVNSVVKLPSVVTWNIDSHYDKLKCGHGWHKLYVMASLNYYFCDSSSIHHHVGPSVCIKELQKLISGNESFCVGIYICSKDSQKFLSQYKRYLWFYETVHSSTTTSKEFKECIFFWVLKVSQWYKKGVSLKLF